MNTYSVMQIPNGKYAVLKPLNITRPNYGDIKMPEWMPNGFTHMGIFKTLEEALVRMDNLACEVTHTAQGACCLDNVGAI